MGSPPARQRSGGHKHLLCHPPYPYARGTVKGEIAHHPLPAPHRTSRPRLPGSPHMPSARTCRFAVNASAPRTLLNANGYRNPASNPPPYYYMCRAWGPLSRRLPPGGGEVDFARNLIMAACPVPHSCSTRLPPSTPFDPHARHSARGLHTTRRPPNERSAGVAFVRLYGGQGHGSAMMTGGCGVRG
jgi:hypothetical protein